MTATLNSNGDVCAIQKAGGVGVMQSVIMQCLRIASMKAADITLKIKEAVRTSCPIVYTHITMPIMITLYIYAPLMYDYSYIWFSLLVSETSKSSGVLCIMEKYQSVSFLLGTGYLS